jgi:hypothetical protein
MRPKTLLEVLSSKRGGQGYKSDLDKIKEKAANSLEQIQRTFPYYTEHNIEHSNRVIRRLDYIIPDSLKDRFNELELFFLVASAYLHDIGMQRFSEDIENAILGKTGKENRKSLSIEQIRDQHHLRSEEYIKQFYRDLSIEDNHQAIIIARICRGHRNEDLFDRELYNPYEAYKHFPINVPLLAALLRVGDELDITFERTSLSLFDRIPLEDEVSKREWEKHLSISGVVLVAGDPLTITSSAHCKNPKIHRLLKKLQIKIDAQVKDVPKHLHDYRSTIKDIPRQFEMHITPDGYVAYDFKFSLEAEEIIKLLMGVRLYRSPGESIRELLKNSLDSCRLKKRRKGLSYNPVIEFQLAQDNSSLTICDNGCGMDQYIIENFFTRIGQSYYHSTQFLEQEPGFPSVSELGIGIISCFMIAKRMVVETKAENEPAFRIEIEDVADYFIVRNAVRAQEGTQITLQLKEEAKGMDFREVIRTYARHLNMPIIVQHGSEKDLINDVGYEPKKGIPPRCKFEPFEIKHNEVEGTIGLLVRRSDRGLVTSCRGTKFGEQPPDMHFISYEGIFVTNQDISPSWLWTKAGTSIFTDLNLKKRSCLKLNIARNELIADGALARIKKTVETDIAKSIWKYLDKLEKSSLDANFEFKAVSNAFFKTFIRFANVADDETCKLVSSLYQDFYYFQCISKSGSSYMRADEISKAKKPVIVFDSVPNASGSIYDSAVDWWRRPNTNYLVDLIGKCTGFSDDELYVIPDYSYFSHRNIWKLLGIILPNHKREGFLTRFEFELDKRLDDVVLTTWRVCRFSNYDSHRFIEFTSSYTTYLNSENRFIRLLLENHKRLTRRQKLLIKDFCDKFEADLRENLALEAIQERQIAVLETFVSARSIQQKDIGSYLITKDDFPPDLLEELAG